MSFRRQARVRQTPLAVITPMRAASPAGGPRIEQVPVSALVARLFMGRAGHALQREYWSPGSGTTWSVTPA